MQQMAYDGTQLKQIENAFVNEENTDDYTKNNVLLAIINIIPMSLTAAGGYDLLTKIS